jgi:hypothetical protein
LLVNRLGIDVERRVGGCSVARGIEAFTCQPSSRKLNRNSNALKGPS